MTRHNAIWYFLALLFLCILVLTISAMGQEIQVDPEFIDVDLVGGDTVTENITVRWTGSDIIQCFISTNITSDCPGNDSEGINITYSVDSPFDLMPNTNYIIEMTIKPAINIMPGIYTITTNFSCEVEEPPTGDKGDGGGPSGGGGGAPPSPPTNQNPIANASAGEPYTGYIDDGIIFNGSLSKDSDGVISSWNWDFGDGTNGSGEIVTHTYSSDGPYIIILTVIDDDGATDSYETVVTISKPNRPPTSPEISGPTEGNKNIEYEYTFVSTDADNDTIKYSVDWGDGTVDESDFLPNGTAFEVVHSWDSAGKYIVTITADDNQTSTSTEMIVMIDAIDAGDIGYITDDDGDGTYDTFHSPRLETDLGQENGKYLIDIDGDGEWDYEYNSKTNTLAPHIPAEEEEKDIAPWYALVALIVMAAIGVTSFVYFVHRVKKKEKDKVKKNKKLEK